MINLPPYWKQEPPPTLPDPAFNLTGKTGLVLKGTSEDIGEIMAIGSVALLSVVDIPPHSNTNDALFYIARYDTGYNIDILATRQVGLLDSGTTLRIENKGTSTEQYKWSIIHLI